MMIANMIPMANANPIWKKLLNTVTGGFVPARCSTKPATEARPGNLSQPNKEKVNAGSIDQRPSCLELSVHIEKNTRSLAYTLPQPTRTSTLKSQHAIGDGFGGNDMARGVALKGLRDTDLDIVGLESLKVIFSGW
jgi:hypothetical protein